MEEEKKEECCAHKKFHHCCEHKAGRIILLVLAVAFIFSIGVWVGSCESRGNRQFNFEQRGGRGMMNNQKEVGDCRFQKDNQEAAGGCPMQNGSGARQATGGCQMQNQTATPVTPTATPVKAITPIK